VALAIIVLVGAAALAVALGGSWTSFATLRVHSVGLVVIAVLAQLLGSGLARLTDMTGFYAAGLAVSALAALGFCLRNLQIAGVPLLTIGLVLNAFVVLLNGAMPVSIVAAARANVGIVDIAAGNDARHEIAGRGTTLRSLGDDIPVPLPLRPEVVSPGDTLIAAGIGELVLLGMRPRRRAIRSADSTASQPAAVALT
jgi:hypothetical protein